jgi:MbtH protein
LETRVDQQTEDWDYKVLVNHEEQYSIWPDFKDIPVGWTAVGPVGDKATCLAWITEHWTDMRPKSIRT